MLCDLRLVGVGVDDLDDIGRDWTATMSSSKYDISDAADENEKMSFVWEKYGWDMVDDSNDDG